MVGMHRLHRVAILIGLLVVGLAGLIALEPIAQDPDYRVPRTLAETSAVLC